MYTNRNSALPADEDKTKPLSLSETAHGYIFFYQIAMFAMFASGLICVVMSGMLFSLWIYPHKASSRGDTHWSAWIDMDHSYSINATSDDGEIVQFFADATHVTATGICKSIPGASDFQSAVNCVHVENLYQLSTCPRIRHWLLMHWLTKEVYLFSMTFLFAVLWCRCTQSSWGILTGNRLFVAHIASAFLPLIAMLIWVCFSVWYKIQDCPGIIHDFTMWCSYGEGKCKPQQGMYLAIVGSIFFVFTLIFGWLMNSVTRGAWKEMYPEEDASLGAQSPRLDPYDTLFSDRRPTSYSSFD